MGNLLFDLLSGKFQYDNGLNTRGAMRYAQGQKFRDEDKMRKIRDEIINKIIGNYRNDANDSIQSNPDYSFKDSVVPKYESVQDKAAKSLIGSTDFAPQYNKPEEQSPISFKKGLSLAELAQRNPMAFSLAGVKSSALPYGMRTGDQNQQAALIDGKLAPSWEQADTSKRKWFETDRDTGLKLQGEGRKQHETTVQYGNNEGLEKNLAGLAKRWGLDGMQFNYDKTGGYKPAVAQSQVAKNILQGQASLIRASKPSGGGGRGGSGGGSGNDSIFSKSEQQALTRSQATINAFHTRWRDPYTGELRQGHERDPLFKSYQQAVAIENSIYGKRQQLDGQDQRRVERTGDPSIDAEIDKFEAAGVPPEEIERARDEEIAKRKKNTTQPVPEITPEMRNWKY